MIILPIFKHESTQHPGLQCSLYIIRFRSLALYEISEKRKKKTHFFHLQTPYIILISLPVIEKHEYKYIYIYISLVCPIGDSSIHYVHELHTNGICINMMRELRGLGVSVAWRRGAGLRRGLKMHYGISNNDFFFFSGISPQIACIWLRQGKAGGGDDTQQRLWVEFKSTTSAVNGTTCVGLNHHFTPGSK